jgi:hypothetical protein
MTEPTLEPIILLFVMIMHELGSCLDPVTSLESIVSTKASFIIVMYLALIIPPCMSGECTVEIFDVELKGSVHMLGDTHDVMMSGEP